MAAWKLGPALAAGCTIVLKPAEQTPLTALRLGELALEAGFPEGVINVVTGDGETGAALVDHPGVDKIAFTGSTAVGREIGAKAGRALKRVTLELGGKSPNIILPDADLEAAVKGAFSGIYFNSGQACNAASRLFVQKDQFDEVVGALAEQAKATVPGPGLDPKTFVGPVISRRAARARQRLHRRRQDARPSSSPAAGPTSATRRLLHRARRCSSSDSDDDTTIVREEIFGPVLVAQPYESLEEVAERANDTEYGLAAGVWTRDISNAHKLAELLRAGSVYVNSWGVSDPARPVRRLQGVGHRPRARPRRPRGLPRDQVRVHHALGGERRSAGAMTPDDRRSRPPGRGLAAARRGHQQRRADPVRGAHGRLRDLRPVLGALGLGGELPVTALHGVSSEVDERLRGRKLRRRVGQSFVDEAHCASARSPTGRFSGVGTSGVSRRYHSASSAAWQPDAGGGDRLAVGVVDEVAGREHAGQLGPRGLALGDDVAVLVEVDLALDDRRLAARGRSR